MLPTANTANFNCESIEAWKTKSVYTNGDQIESNNLVYQAKWWTQNQAPAKNSTRWAVWKPLGECAITNQAPIVTLIAPLSNTSVEYQQTIQLSANATDSDGYIQQVDFYINNQLVASRDAKPYQVNWQVIEPIDSIYVIATDDQQAKNQSPDIKLNVIYPSTVQLQIFWSTGLGNKLNGRNKCR